MARQVIYNLQASEADLAPMFNACKAFLKEEITLSFLGVNFLIWHVAVDLKEGPGNYIIEAETNKVLPDASSRRLRALMAGFFAGWKARQNVEKADGVNAAQ